MTPAPAKHENNNLQNQGSVHQLPTIVAAPEERYLPFPLTDIQQAYWARGLEGVELGAVRLTTTEIDCDGLDWSALTLPGSEPLSATTCCGRWCRPMAGSAFSRLFLLIGSKPWP